MKDLQIFLNMQDHSLTGKYLITYFSLKRAELKDVVEAAMEDEKEEAKRNEYLNNLMKGKIV